MTRILPMSWAYAVMPDQHARLGKATTLVVREAGDDYTVLGIFPGPELAERFLEVLVTAPHESLFDSPMVLPRPVAVTPPDRSPDPRSPR